MIMGGGYRRTSHLYLCTTLSCKVILLSFHSLRFKYDRTFWRFRGVLSEFLIPGVKRFRAFLCSRVAIKNSTTSYKRDMNLPE